MSRPKKFVLAFVVIAVALVGYVVKTFYDAGEFKEIRAHSQGLVQTITGVQSSEDITINPLTGIGFISSADRRAQFAGRKTQQGGVFAYALKAENAQPINLTADFEKEFNPHGISLFIHEDSSTTLFAINHNREGDFVEIFDEQDSAFVHRKSIASPLMFSPNDLVAVDADRFYVTNDHGNRTAFWRTFEEYLQLNRSYVLYYDGTGFQIVAEGLAYANGINTSPDGKTVYVAATVDGAIYVYDRDPETGALDFVETIDLDTGVDNIEVDPAGNLWIGGHPKLLTFVDYSKDAAILSPSHVLKVIPSASGDFEIEDIFIDDGSRLCGSSVAAVYGNKLLIGSVFDAKFLVCTL
jgi:arylesterase/paraoxonase